jgi:hypothetical protein
MRRIERIGVAETVLSRYLAAIQAYSKGAGFGFGEHFLEDTAILVRQVLGAVAQFDKARAAEIPPFGARRPAHCRSPGIPGQISPRVRTRPSASEYARGRALRNSAGIAPFTSMISIPITEEAYEALKARTPRIDQALTSKGRNGKMRIWLERTFVDGLLALRALARAKATSSCGWRRRPDHHPFTSLVGARPGGRSGGRCRSSIAALSSAPRPSIGSRRRSGRCEKVASNTTGAGLFSRQTNRPPRRNKKSPAGPGSVDRGAKRRAWAGGQERRVRA